jgi:hypothetical protein
MKERGNMTQVGPAEPPHLSAEYCKEYNTVCFCTPCETTRRAEYDAREVLAKAATVARIAHFCNRADNIRWQREPEHCESCGVCDAYEARREQTKRGIVPPIYLVSASVSRHYGGPEEGGWWYDVQVVDEVRVAYTVKAAVRHVHELREKFPTCPRGRGSVIGGDDTYVRICYGEDDPRWPSTTTERPRYE